MNENINENKQKSKSNLDLEFILMNDYQKNFPMTTQPFLTIAENLGVSEDLVISIYQKLLKEGKLSRIGPIFAPGVFGVSTLAAMKVDPKILIEIAEIVSSFPEVNHNYERSHELNLWFVVMADSAENLKSAIENIELKTNHKVYSFPLVKEFRIDLGFSMRGSVK